MFPIFSQFSWYFEGFHSHRTFCSLVFSSYSHATTWMIAISIQYINISVCVSIIIFLFFRKAKDSCGRDVWLTNGTYWKLRENPGFANTENIILWWWWDDSDEQNHTKTHERDLKSISGGYLDSIYEPLWDRVRIVLRISSSFLLCAHDWLMGTRQSPVKVQHGSH